MHEQVEVPISSISFSEAVDEAIGLLRKYPEEITKDEKKKILASLSKLGEGLSSPNPEIFIKCARTLADVVFHASTSDEFNEDRYWEYHGKNQDIFVFALEVASKHLKELFDPLSSGKSDEETRERQENGLHLINLVAEKRLDPQVEQSILSGYKKFLPKIVEGILTGKYYFDGALFIYLSHYPKRFITVQNLITSSLSELQREELNPIMGAFFEPEAQEQRKDFGEEISKMILQKFGFPPEHTEKLSNNWWKYLGSSELHDIQICENLKNIIELEQRVPGISSWLMSNFGIRHFGRYPIELLLDQYMNFDDKDSPWGVFLYSYYDYNAIFHGQSWMMRDL